MFSPLLLTLLVLPTGCEKAPSDVALVCPPVVEYSAADQRAAAEEVEAIAPTAPHVVKFMSDYGALRKANRECTKGKR